VISNGAFEVVFFERGKTPQVKILTDITPYVGGLGLAAKLNYDFKQPSLAIGPLTGCYPGASGLFLASQGKPYFLNSRLALDLKLKGLAGVVSNNISLAELLPLLSKFLEKLSEKELNFSDNLAYEKLYSELWERVGSVWGYSLSSDQSQVSPQLIKSVDLSTILGGNQKLAGVYNDPALAFAALGALGYDYSHEVLEQSVAHTKKLLIL